MPYYLYNCALTHVDNITHCVQAPNNRILVGSRLRVSGSVLGFQIQGLRGFWAEQLEVRGFRVYIGSVMSD